jgi:4-alpha-glucanotransferase
VLLPLFSLPGEGSVGGLGPAARRWVRGLAAAGHSVWQVLPPGPLGEGGGNSPYAALSSFALDPVWLSGNDLVADGLLERAGGDRPRGGRISWVEARRAQEALGREAVQAVGPDASMQRFADEQRTWLEDWALYAVLRRQSGAAWTGWPEALRDREPAAIDEARRRAGEALRRERVLQFLLDRQWRRLRSVCAEVGVEWMGDLPFYPAPDSADVWGRPALFRLDAAGLPERVAGCPPDAYSELGQHWGNPVYRWPVHVADGFAWWRSRLRRQLELFDSVRLDHFRGLVATWQIPTGAAAADGFWEGTPPALACDALGPAGEGRLLAEDLGVITQEVHALRRRIGAPGTRVVQFGFGDDHAESEHLPEHCPPDCVLYSSTHDSDTLLGWVESRVGGERDRLQGWLGRPPRGEAAVLEMLERVYASPAELVVVTLQDVLALGPAGRINRPGEAWGQWEWRLEDGQGERALERLTWLAAGSGRASARSPDRRSRLD